jgi:hypothetical protein
VAVDAIVGLDVKRPAERVSQAHKKNTDSKPLQFICLNAEQMAKAKINFMTFRSEWVYKYVMK